MEEDKLLPSQEQQDQLLHSLNPFFLMNTLESIALAKLQNAEDLLHRNTKELQNKLLRIQQAFALNPLSGTPGEMAIQLSEELAEDYYIAPSQLYKLSQITQWRSYLMKLPKGTGNHEAALQERAKRKGELPESLLIK